MPLREVDAQLQMIEDLLTQLELLAVPEMADLTELEPEQIADLVRAKQQAVALELQQMKQEQQELYAQAINRMLNRAAYETRQLVGQEAMLVTIALRPAPLLKTWPVDEAGSTQLRA